jgi:hypothetical protein
MRLSDVSRPGSAGLPQRLRSADPGIGTAAYAAPPRAKRVAVRSIPVPRSALLGAALPSAPAREAARALPTHGGAVPPYGRAPAALADLRARFRNSPGLLRHGVGHNELGVPPQASPWQGLPPLPTGISKPVSLPTS